jgi:hypothetical protein
MQIITDHVYVHISISVIKFITEVQCSVAEIKAFRQ